MTCQEAELTKKRLNEFDALDADRRLLLSALERLQGCYTGDSSKVHAVRTIALDTGRRTGIGAVSVEEFSVCRITDYEFRVAMEQLIRTKIEKLDKQIASV